jgi:hypothetical protein
MPVIYTTCFNDVVRQLGQFGFIGFHFSLTISVVNIYAANTSSSALAISSISFVFPSYAPPHISLLGKYNIKDSQTQKIGGICLQVGGKCEMMDGRSPIW